MTIILEPRTGFTNIVYALQHILYQWKLGFAMISVLGLTYNNFVFVSLLFSKLSEVDLYCKQSDQ